MLSHKERRQHTRFRPKDGTMAVSNHALGPVVNISMGGLSFRYMGTDPSKPMLDMLGIFLGSDNVLIENIPTKIITDKLISQSTTFLKTSTRQCSIQFTKLTKSQKKNLKDFISTKTLSMY